MPWYPSPIRLRKERLAAAIWANSANASASPQAKGKPSAAAGWGSRISAGTISAAKHSRESNPSSSSICRCSSGPGPRCRTRNGALTGDQSRAWIIKNFKEGCHVLGSPRQLLRITRPSVTIDFALICGGIHQGVDFAGVAWNHHQQPAFAVGVVLQLFRIGKHGLIARLHGPRDRSY